MPSIESMSTARSRRPTCDQDGFRLRIDGSSHAAGRARSEMTRLNAELEGPLLDRMRLLVTEVVSNSVRHAGARTVELSVAVSPEWVRVEVVNDGEPFDPAASQFRREAGGAGRDANMGWGLFLIDSLSHDWGVVEDIGCQRVWFEIARA